MSLKLVKQNQELVERDKLYEQIASLVATGLSTVKEIADNLGLTFAQASILLNDPQVITILTNQTKAQGQLLFHSKVIPIVEEILRTGDNKERIASIKLLGEMTGNVKGSTNVNVQNMNLSIPVEERIKQVNSQKDNKLEKLVEESELVIDIKDLGGKVNTNE